MGKKVGFVSLLVVFVIFCGNVWGADRGGSSLSNSDCIKCHKQQPATIDAHGGKHKTEVGCLDCHTEHPPEGKNAVPQCNVCHSGAPHYKLENCGSCHSDPHAPLDLTIEGDVKEACLTCHKKVGIQLKDHPSAHSDLACNECHTKHRLIPSCMECHEKHTDDMDLASCLVCHPVHMPLVVTYGKDIPSHYCAACHGEAAKLLKKNTTKHKDLSCVYCHRDKHKTVPTCLSCKIPHGEPHPAKMLQKFPECGQCHGIAHDIRK
jgi:hypothetical protein